MQPLIFKTLVHYSTIVDVSLLDKGIYSTKKPALYEDHITKEDILKTAKEIASTISNFDIKSFEINLEKCSLVPVKVKIIL